MTSQESCSQISLGSQEPIFGTATPTDTYLLLEYPHAWGPKAIPDSSLPSAVKAWLDERTASLPQAKALLIRRDAGHEDRGWHFFVAVSREKDPVLYEFHLERYEDLLELDISAILAGDPTVQTYRSTEPLLIVCTHGRRDLCCARNGLPVYRALRDAGAVSPPHNVWQVSHLGGHRFAANLVCLPYGFLYGRVEPENALSILEAYHSGAVYLPNLRGRTPYPKIAQAAEYHLRKQTGDMKLDSFLLQGTSEITPDTWRVHFDTKDHVSIYDLKLRVEDSGNQVYQGCQLDKTTPLIEYKLVSYEERAVHA